MRIGIIFTFDTTHKTRNEKSKFYRKLYGFTEFSHFGEYSYDRPGTISKLPHLRPTQSVVIIRKEHAHILREFFKNEKVRFSEHKIILTEKEFRKLS